ncbi:MAG: hypothetical protein WCX16_02135 [Candidatus Omnitrophota bacterium]
MNHQVEHATDSKITSDTQDGISIRDFNGLINTAYGIATTVLLAVTLVVISNKGLIGKTREETKNLLNEVLTASNVNTEAPAVEPTTVTNEFESLVTADTYEEPIYTSAVPNSMDDYPPVEKDAFANN